MQWNKDTLKEVRTSAKLSQPALAEALGVHFRTVQNWEKGATPIPTSVSLALDKLFGESQDVVSREEYDKVVAALESATELNKKLTDIIQSGAQIRDKKELQA
jgi:transcriptional regulator with XRE-family HTH domain